MRKRKKVDSKETTIVQNTNLTVQNSHNPQKIHSLLHQRIKTYAKGYVQAH
ncbi:hypothetical protein SAMN05421676_102366 [Salinibacillus kushneri]|uniref:Uncharacterized protein n=1 Tax=Salinibacillus kushneri TaxID=237682 RepID=A0A1I0B6Y0_9BACI|nr:hypothetical protein SAMN05421676_102366 [Salinibacillus kushneri]